MENNLEKYKKQGYKIFKNEELETLLSKVGVNHLIESGILSNISQDFYKATSSNLTKYSDGTTSSMSNGSNGIKEHSGFIDVNFTDFTPLIMYKLLSIAFGMSYLNQINDKLINIDNKINCILSFLNSHEKGKVISYLKKLDLYQQKKDFSDIHLIDIENILNEINIIIESRVLFANEKTEFTSEFILNSKEKFYDKILALDKYEYLHPNVLLIALVSKVAKEIDKKLSYDETINLLKKNNILIDLNLLAISTYLLWGYRFLKLRALFSINKKEYYEDIQLILNDLNKYKMSEDFQRIIKLHQKSKDEFFTFLKQDNSSLFNSQESINKDIDAIKLIYNQSGREIEILFDQMINHKITFDKALNSEIFISVYNDEYYFMCK